MNVGLVTTWFERGAAYVSRQYMEALSSDLGNRVFVYARGGEAYAKKNDRWDKENVTWGKKSKRYYYGVTSIDRPDFIGWLKKKRIDVVLFNEQNWWEPVLWCKEMGIITGTYVDYYTEETVPFFAAYDFLICNTQRHYNLFKEIAHAYYVPWGTDIDLFRPQSKKDAEASSVVFFHSAGMNPIRKGTDSTIRAFAAIDDPNSRLLIHTQERLSAYLDDEVCRIAERHPRISVVQKTVPAPGLYTEGDVYVYPSILDGLGLTVVEALACGLPCIVSDNAPMNEFVQPGVNGRLITIDYLYARSDGYFWPQCKISLSSLEEELQFYLLHRSSIESEKVKARQSAEEQYNWKDRYKQICALFKEVKHEPIDEVLSRRIYSYEQHLNGKYNMLPYAFYYWKKWRSGWTR